MLCTFGFALTQLRHLSIRIKPLSCSGSYHYILWRMTRKYEPEQITVKLLYINMHRSPFLLNWYQICTSGFATLTTNLRTKKMRLAVLGSIKKPHLISTLWNQMRYLKDWIGAGGWTRTNEARSARDLQSLVIATRRLQQFGSYGAVSRVWTGDLRLTMATLCQLSYHGILPYTKLFWNRLVRLFKVLFFSLSSTF